MASRRPLGEFSSAVSYHVSFRMSPMTTSLSVPSGIDDTPLRLTGWEKVRFRTQMGDITLEEPGKPEWRHVFHIYIP